MGNVFTIFVFWTQTLTADLREHNAQPIFRVSGVKQIGSLSNDDDEAEDEPMPSKKWIYILQAKFVIV